MSTFTSAPPSASFSSPHLFTGLVPEIGLTLVLAPPLLGSLDLAASFALAARQGRDHFVSCSPAVDRGLLSGHLENDPRPKPDFAFHPVLFATHHRHRVETLFDSHPIGTLRKTPAAPILYHEPPALDSANDDPADFLAALRANLDQLAAQTQRFAASLTAAASSPDPAADPIHPPTRPVGNPVIILTPLFPAHLLAGNAARSACAAVTKLLAAFAQAHQVTIIAFIDCGPSPRNLASALNTALTLPGVDAILSLAADPEAYESRILTCHVARGLRARPQPLLATLMEPRLGARPIPVSPVARFVAPNLIDHRSRVNATKWLSDYLESNDNLCAVADVVPAAHAQGISRSALYRARHALRLINGPEDTHSGPTWQRDSTPIDTFTHRYIEKLNQPVTQPPARQTASPTPPAPRTTPTPTPPSPLSPPASSLLPKCPSPNPNPTHSHLLQHPPDTRAA